MKGWNPERIETAKRMWGEGCSASEIAAEIGGELSRNAVIGKMHRLGLKHRPRAKSVMANIRHRPGDQRRRPNESRDARKHNRPPKPPKEARQFGTAWAPATNPRPPQEVEMPKVSESVEHKTLVHRRACECHWPVNFVSTQGEQLFCCRPIDPASPLPYCDEHLKRRVAKERSPQQRAADERAILRMAEARRSRWAA